MLRNVLRRSFPDAGEAARLRAFGAEHPDALADRIFRARPNLIASSPSLEAALDRAPDVRARALARAEAIAARRFPVFGRTVSFEGREIDWSFDAGSGRSYALRASTDPALLEPGMDPKFAWALGRMESAVALGQGFRASKDPAQQARFAEAFVDQTAHFLSANPVGQGVHWVTPMEVSLRAANLAVALLMFEGAQAVREPAFLLGVLSGLEAHVSFVAARLEDQGAVPNNHLVADWVGMLVVSALLPELPCAPRCLALALRGVRRELSRQVHEDGYAFEGSVPYHRLSLELFTLAFVIAGRHGFPLGTGYAARLKRMFAVANAYCSDTGLAPQVGDNDSGRALPLTDRPSLEHGYLASLGAALFAEPSLKRPGSRLCDEAVWMLGEDGWSTFERLPARRPPAGFSSAAGGLHLLRAGPAVLTVSAGQKGQRGVGGHNHLDQLSFELHVAGVPVIVDPGTGDYTRDPDVRNRLRASDAHNTLSVDGKEQAPLNPRRLFALPDPHPAEVTAFVAGEELGRMELSSRAFAPIGVRRGLILDARAGALGVVEDLDGGDAHTLTAWLHLPDVEIAMRPPTDAERARALQVPFAPRSFAEQALVLGAPERAVVLLEEGTGVRVEEAVYSPGYGELRPARRITLEWTLRLPSRVGWVLLWGTGGSQGAGGVQATPPQDGGGGDEGDGESALGADPKA